MLKYFVILAVLLCACFYGCGDNLNPLESQDSNSPVKIEIQKLVAEKEVNEDLLPEGKFFNYNVWFVVSVTNLGNKDITIADLSSYLFAMRDIKGPVTYDTESVWVFDPAYAESIIGIRTLDDFVSIFKMGNGVLFTVKPKTTVLVGLFTAVSTEPIGEWNLIFVEWSLVAREQMHAVIPVQKMIEQAVASGKEILDPSSGGKDSAGNIGNQPKEITSSDGAPMALIPAGAFQMGSSDERQDERPIHTVYLDAFYIDKYEVTNAQYRRFSQARRRNGPEGFGIDMEEGNKILRFGFKPWEDENFNSDDQPVVCVSWEDANAYAKWAGKRLPTEAEWEKAARGGLVGKKYVWGDQYKSGGNFADEIFDGYTYPAPVGSFAPNGYGLYDMAGNVWEWCMDWYDPAYYTQSPKKNPTGPISGNNRILRGGSWVVSDIDFYRVSARYYKCPSYSYADIGFRCTMDAE